jgi:hypothetical protein
MGKRLLVAVHFADTETGESRVLTPADKLSAADRRLLEKNWGKRVGEIMEDDGDDEDVAALSAEDLPVNAGAPADTALPATDKPAPAVQESVESNQAVREADAKDASTSGTGQGAARARK